MKIIDGKAIALGIREEIASEVRLMLGKGQAAPHLAIVLVGDNPASKTYIKYKEKACKEVGFISTIYNLPDSTSEDELLKIINFINNDDEVDGFIVQVPLPKHINEKKIAMAIAHTKDVDGFHPINTGRMTAGTPCYLPATPFGIIKLIEKANIETEGKHCVVVGRSDIVGTPISILLSRNSNPGNCTVTLCHSKTADLKKHTLNADILICAIGKPNFIKADMVKEGAVVIDVGINRVNNLNASSKSKLVGDVDFDEVSKKCSYITPVPGGVGPMTIAGLLLNTLQAARKEIYS